MTWLKLKTTNHASVSQKPSRVNSTEQWNILGKEHILFTAADRRESCFRLQPWCTIRSVWSFAVLQKAKYNGLSVYWIWRSTEFPCFTLNFLYSPCYVIFSKQSGHCSRSQDQKVYKYQTIFSVFPHVGLKAAKPHWYLSALVWLTILTRSNLKSQSMSQLMRLWYLSHRRTVKAQARLHILAVSPEPSLFAHLKHGSRRRVWPKIRHVAPVDCCACVFEDWVYGGR